MSMKRVRLAMHNFCDPFLRMFSSLVQPKSVCQLQSHYSICCLSMLASPPFVPHHHQRHSINRQSHYVFLLLLQLQCAACTISLLCFPFHIVNEIVVSIKSAWLVHAGRTHTHNCPLQFDRINLYRFDVHSVGRFDAVSRNRIHCRWCFCDGDNSMRSDAVDFDLCVCGNIMKNRSTESWSISSATSSAKIKENPLRSPGEN